MNQEIQFISLDDALHFHEEEIRRAGGTPELRDMRGLEAAIAAPQASFSGQYLMDTFGMAATYVQSICSNHPFLDGNKRTAAACALVFLYLNGYELNENYDEELADKVLALVTRKISKDDLAEYFKQNTSDVE